MLSVKKILFCYVIWRRVSYMHLSQIKYKSYQFSVSSNCMWRTGGDRLESSLK